MPIVENLENIKKTTKKKPTYNSTYGGKLYCLMSEVELAVEGISTGFSTHPQALPLSTW